MGDVPHRRTRNRLVGNSTMSVEIPVFNRKKRFDEMRRNLLQLYWHTPPEVLGTPIFHQTPFAVVEAYGGWLALPQNLYLVIKRIDDHTGQQKGHQSQRKNTKAHPPQQCPVFLQESFQLNPFLHSLQYISLPPARLPPRSQDVARAPPLLCLRH